MHISLHFKILKISLIKSNKTENPYFLPTPSMIVFSELSPQFRYTSLTGMSVVKKKCQMSISPLSDRAVHCLENHGCIDQYSDIRFFEVKRSLGCVI